MLWDKAFYNKCYHNTLIKPALFHNNNILYVIFTTQAQSNFQHIQDVETLHFPEGIFSWMSRIRSQKSDILQTDQTQSVAVVFCFANSGTLKWNKNPSLYLSSCCSVTMCTLTWGFV